jgi:hypothetical protein
MSVELTSSVWAVVPSFLWFLLTSLGREMTLPVVDIEIAVTLASLTLIASE